MSVNIEGVLEVFKLQDTLNVYELIFIAIEMAKEVIITPDLKRFFHPLKVPQHTCSSLVGISEQLPQTQRSLSVFFISDSGQHGVSYLGHKRPKMLKNSE